MHRRTPPTSSFVTDIRPFVQQMVRRKVHKSTSVTVRTKAPHTLLRVARELLEPACTQCTVDTAGYFIKVHMHANAHAHAHCCR